MSYSLVAAMDLNRLIGQDNRLPWHIPADLKAFKQNTLGKSILMGRKTCESLPKPLPKRTNYVLSHNQQFKKEGFIIINDIDKLPKDEEIMIIGGGAIYELFLPVCDKMILTTINGEFKGDTYFPEVDLSEWKLCLKTHYPINESNPTYAFDVITYTKIVD